MYASMSEPDDWDPLPDVLRVAHPGELGAAAVRAASPEPEPPTAAIPAAPPPPPPDPAAAAALRDLQQRLAASKPASSWIAAVQHREQRQQRRRAAAAAPFADEAKVVHSTLRGPEDVPLTIEHEQAVGHDARERERWFQALPEAEQHRLRTTWAGRQQQAVCSQMLQRRQRNRRTVAAVLIACVTVVLGTGFAWHATVGAGVLCGIWWRHVAPDRFRDPLLAAACLLAAHVLAMVVNGLPPRDLFLDAILTMALAAVVGFDGEMRRTGGFTDA